MVRYGVLRRKKAATATGILALAHLLLLKHCQFPHLTLEPRLGALVLHPIGTPALPGCSLPSGNDASRKTHFFTTLPHYLTLPQLTRPTATKQSAETLIISLPIPLHTHCHKRNWYSKLTFPYLSCGRNPSGP